MSRRQFVYSVLKVALAILATLTLTWLLTAMLKPLADFIDNEIYNVRPDHGVVEHVAHEGDEEVLISFKSDRNTAYHCNSGWDDLDVCQLVQPGDQISFRFGEQYGDPTIVALTIE